MAAMDFGVVAVDSSVRADLVDSQTSPLFRDKAFRVFASLSTTAEPEPVDVFNDVEVAYDGGGITGWNYGGGYRYWAPSGTYSFRAFWPSTTLVEGTATTTSLVLQYSTATDNDDMMVAYYTCQSGNPDTNGDTQPVSMKFYHALSAVAVRFFTNENSGCEYKVTNAYYTSIYRLGSLSFTQVYNPETPPAWKRGDGTSYWRAILRGNNDEYSVDRIREHSGTWSVPHTTDSANPQYVTLPWQLMIPQSLVVESDQAKPGICFTVEVLWSGGEKIVKDIWLELPVATVDEWEPSKKYMYEVMLQSTSFDITVQTTDWEDIDAVCPDISF